MQIIKIKSSLGSLGKNKGTEKAPDLILKDLKGNFQILEIKEENNLDKLNKKLENTQGDIFIGGDHSITYSLFKGLKGVNKGLIMFDAHPDCDTYTNTATHEDFLRKLVDENQIKKENIILIGLRSYSNNEINFLKENKIKYYTTEKIFDIGIKEITEIIMEIANTFSDLYISIDIDVLDPCYAPGTGYQEPAGLSTLELIYILKKLKLLKNLRRIDLVEVNPNKDINNLTINVAKKILKVFI
ncbi:MAG: arginase family protein [Nanoarchaeota archaeon]|nr:arginase family protein [Nanoarchaeota archaeon]